jgi:hypothetical protein
MPLRHIQGGGVELRSFLNFALDGTDLSDSRPGRLISMQINAGTHWIGGLVGPGDGVHTFGEEKYPLSSSSSSSSPPPPPHHHHVFKDWGLVAHSSLNISLCNGCTVFVFPAGWFFITACGSLCLPSLLTRCTHLLSQLLICTKTARISSSFKMVHHLKQITSLCVHHSGVVLQLMIPGYATKMRIATVMGANGATLTSSCVAMK